MDVDLLVDRPAPALPEGEHEDVDGDPVGQLVPDPGEPVQPIFGPEQVQPDLLPGPPAQVQQGESVPASVPKTAPRKRAIKEKWIMKP